MAEYDRSATGPLPVDAGPRRAENIFDLSPEDFRASLGELQALNHDTDALMRQYRARNSPFAPINNAAAAQAQDLADSGRRPVLGGLLSKPEGATGWDAITGLEREGWRGLLGAGQQVGQAFDAPSAAAQGLIPQADVNMEALNTAGMAMGAGGAATAPIGALRSGLARDGRVNQVKIGNTNVVYSLGNDGVAEISSIRTPQAGRGQGSARAALQSVISDLQGAGASSVRLIPSPLDNKTSPARLAEFYDSLGFSRTGQAANMAGDEWMSMDLSANASQSGGLLGAGLSEAQRQARDILDMRAAGNARSVTDDMMSRADDQYMFDNTPLPMDEASRLARADAGGFGSRPVYHGSPDAREVLSQGFSRQTQNIMRDGGDWADGAPRPIFTTNVRKVADTYADDERAWDYQNADPATIELLRRQGNDATVNAGGARFRGIDEDRVAAGTGADMSRYRGQVQDGEVSTDGISVMLSDMGLGGAEIRSVVDDYMGNGGISNVQMTFDPSRFRSPTARFDPEFSHLSNLSAANASPAAGLLAMQQEQDKPLPFMEMLRGLLR